VPGNWYPTSRFKWVEKTASLILLVGLLGCKTNIMKKLIFALFLASCSDKDVNDKKAQVWINEHKKPFTCVHQITNGFTYAHGYTIIDSLNNIYFTGEVNIILPDTLD